jgi:ATP-dependent helicase/nuclease subunit B
MAEPIRPSLFSLPFGQDICDAAVSAIFERAGQSPLVLSKVLIFLPNNRAIKAVTEAFVRRAQPGLLLPKMVAIGDLALDEALGPMFDPLQIAPNIPAPITSLQRLMLLAKSVKDSGAAQGKAINPNEALRLGRYLAEVIDELEIEQIRFSQFAETEPSGDLAGHWQKSYAQLLRLIPEYDRTLLAADRIGPAARRNLLLRQLADSLKTDQPANLIVALGISTAAPAIAYLLKVIATLPSAMVIFPAIDVTMADENWERLGPVSAPEKSDGMYTSHESHPQFHLKLLLERMGFRRDELTILQDDSPQLNEVISQIFSLPDDTECWRDLPDAKKNLSHVRLLTAEDIAQEATAIAVLVREALETPQKRIAVVTPDRELAVRVSAQLKRWNINVDDSAGIPLTQTAPGSLFMALAQTMAAQFAPVTLLAVLKHPLVKLGDERLDWLEKVRILDVVMRGPNSGIGLNAAAHRIEAWQAEQTKKNKPTDPNFVPWWSAVQQDLKALDASNSNGFVDILSAIQMVADRLTDGAIWRGEAGRQLSAFIEELNGQNLSALGAINREAIVAVLSELFDRQMVRPPYGGHPRVAIYGLLEARLQQADLVICAGLNEGSWPQIPQPDPWLAPRIRRELKLAGLERNIGLAAHDLATALGAKQVVLTRAKRDRSGPTVASRFLLRIQAFLGKNLVTEDLAVTLALLLEKPEASIKTEKPAPIPSSEQRKSLTLSVTDFDRLMADPFAFYANKILGLRTMDPVDAEPSHAWRGSIVHDILERWANEDACNPEKLNEYAAALLTNSAIHPALRALWQPRIAEGLRWVAEKTTELAKDGRTLLVAEADGKTEIEGIAIRGRADRIDRLSDGRLAIMDYKTGKAPGPKQVFNGFALQLGLIGLMAESGGIKGVSGISGAFEYWSLAKDNGQFGKISPPTSDGAKKGKNKTDEFVVFTNEKASEAIRQWITGMEPFTAKLHPEYAPYADYDQLMRYDEWNGREPLPLGDDQ